ncbi:NUDIX domain-containing protein [Allostreptomyces psammosilenae]|nr:NUDIX domain-containing protein [Allostreptomyces psammosilenae]
MDTHCGYCGAAYTVTAGWPRVCGECSNTTWRNPLPVAVAMLPVHDDAGVHLVVIRRTIEPRHGWLALPGGFVDLGESWQQGVVRELWEETGIPARAEDVRLAGAYSNQPGSHIMLFGLLPPRPLAELPPSAPTAETLGWELLSAPAELAFPSHTQVVADWFAGEHGGRGGQGGPGRLG